MLRLPVRSASATAKSCSSISCPLQFSGMLSGAVITESIFAIPGIGRLATTAIQNRDMPVLQGTVLFTTVLVIAGNLIADLLYSVLDPRIRKEA